MLGFRVSHHYAVQYQLRFAFISRVFEHLGRKEKEKVPLC